jgi:4-hydroxy-3-polyprenylbenzoate decarboxylase
MKLVIAIGGSSGSIYAKKIINWLATNKKNDIHVDLVFSKNALVNWSLEDADAIPSLPFKVYANNDFFAPFASGSAGYDAMVIIPCSMGLIGRIANGISVDLISRTADVMLKERRKLILVPREAPYNLIHLRNMTTITEAGGIICPASPSFYQRPETIDDLVMTIIYRVLDLLGIENNSYRWGTEEV